MIQRIDNYKKMTKDERIKDTYTKYPVWLFYWIAFDSRTGPDLREFRKTISKTKEPMIEVGKIIDRYKTW